MSKTAAVIGGGPAGLMAAEMLARAGVSVTVYDAKPSMGRKFLMAGKSGLNLTKDEGLEGILDAYGAASEELRPMISVFDAQKVQAFAKGLDQPVFTGSSRRVFPEAMKASPMLRAWFARLDELGVQRQTRWSWTGWEGEALTFATPEGVQTVEADAVVLALGGASWAKLGSDGKWVDTLGVETVPFGPSNVGMTVDWSDHMRRHFGAPIKGVAWTAGKETSRGEGVVSSKGLEGGGVYSLTPALRDGAPLYVDLLPDQNITDIRARLLKSRGKASLSNHLRKSLRLSAVKIAMLQEWARPLPEESSELAAVIKSLPVPYTGLNSMDQAISTSGGVAWSAVDASLMLNDKPGVFVAGEMLDWEAPTGGYLLTACFATGRWAGISAARHLGIDADFHTDRN
jgi:uncharacterized flavoprotein (TIGR03862 family)